MPYPKDHKQRTRRRILASAARLFGARGFDATSIEQVMLDAGLTRGGFYAHFRSKAELYREALGDAGADVAIAPRTDWLDGLFEACRRGMDPNVPSEAAWAFLATDVASRRPEVRQSYARALHSLSERLRDEMTGQVDDADAPLVTTAMIVGTLAVALTVDDASLRSTLADACQRSSHALRGAASADAEPPSFFWMLDEADAAAHRALVHAMR